MTRPESTHMLKTLFALAVMMALAGTAWPATYTVVNTDDSGPGSLREAIALANSHPGLDQIEFNIPSPGPHTIQPSTALPPITDPVTIDGYTQPGAEPATYSIPATLLIELDGTYVSGIGLEIASSGSCLRGLVINRFGDVGVGITCQGGNTIEGNYIGTDVTGTIDRGNLDDGIRIWDAPNNRIGGTTPAARNVISGNGDNGVEIILPGSTGNMVQGNYIGTDATGTAALGNGGNGVLMCEGTSSNTIGPGNVISDNGRIENGIHMGCGIVAVGNPTTTSHLIVGNLVGTDVTGTQPLGNRHVGIGIAGCSGNTLKDNVVSYNDITGISLADLEPGPEPGQAPADDNVITGNTVESNGGFGLQIEISHHNTIYNNNFINNNPIDGYQVVDHGGTGNTFSLPEPIGGNYWSDWTEPDTDCDGIVDLPYPIYTADVYPNQDDFPWACPNGWLVGCGCSMQPLMNQVKALDLSKGIEDSLLAKLETAESKLSDGIPANDHAAVNSLEAFINGVEAQRGKKISQDDADALIAAARAIIDRLESM